MGDVGSISKLEMIVIFRIEILVVHSKTLGFLFWEMVSGV